MNHIRWVAWGVINVDDAESFDRMQRRNYIKRMRAELVEKNITLHCGGSTQAPWYAMELPAAAMANPENGDKSTKQAYAGKDALKKVCAWLLEKIGDTHVRGEDGGVRGAGAETQGAADRFS